MKKLIIAVAVLGSFLLSSCSVAPRGFGLDYGVIATLGVIGIAVLVYLAHYRAQEVENDLTTAERGLWCNLNSLSRQLRDERSRLGATLLRIEKLESALRRQESEESGQTATVDEVLRRVEALEGSTSLSEIGRMVTNLRAEILGGTTSGAMPVAGALSELRQQVEGINSTLGNKVSRLTREANDAVRTPDQIRSLVRMELLAADRRMRAARKENRWFRQVYRWLTATRAPTSSAS